MTPMRKDMDFDVPQWIVRTVTAHEFRLGYRVPAENQAIEPWDFVLQTKNTSTITRVRISISMTFVLRVTMSTNLRMTCCFAVLPKSGPTAWVLCSLVRRHPIALIVFQGCQTLFIQTQDTWNEWQYIHMSSGYI